MPFRRKQTISKIGYTDRHALSLYGLSAYLKFEVCTRLLAVRRVAAGRYM